MPRKPSDSEILTELRRRANKKTRRAASKACKEATKVDPEQLDDLEVEVKHGVMEHMIDTQNQFKIVKYRW